VSRDPLAEGRRWLRQAEADLADGYYIPTRYPDALPDGVPSEVFTTRQATDAIALAAQVLAFAGEHLG
jgi:HEPN domain-containing protein